MPRSNLKILGIIGDPISHSLSPLMQNAALAHLKLPFLYTPFQVKPEFLENFLKNLRTRKIVGLNVTIPHKEAVIPFLDSLTSQARLIGAVNTILVKGKKWIGHNTDGAGFIQSLEKELKISVAGKQVILLGAGGAARGIAVALAQNRAREVLIINRTTQKGFNLMHVLHKKFPKTIFSVGSFEEIEPHFWLGADMLINATSMGMRGKKWVPLPLSKLPSRAVVADIVTNPLETTLLKKAKKLGLKIHAGWGMLLYQGALSFEFWTGKKAPVDVMKKTLLDELHA